MIRISKHRKGGFLSQKDLLFSMVHILSQDVGDVLYELLMMLRPCYGEESCLSIVEIGSRKILSTTEGESGLCDLNKVAVSIKTTGKERRYIKEEIGGSWIRRPYQYGWVIPLPYEEKEAAFLLVEQVVDQTPDVERCVELLNIAIRLQKERVFQEKKTQIEKEGLLLSREDLLLRLEEENKKEYPESTYIGVFSIIHKEEMKRSSKKKDLFLDMVLTLGTEFPNDCYRISDGVLAVWLTEDFFEGCSKLQDGMDLLIETCPMFASGAALIPLQKDSYQTMYLCEKCVKELKEDTVVVIREPESYLLSGLGRIKRVYNGKNTREVV